MVVSNDQIIDVLFATLYVFILLSALIDNDRDHPRGHVRRYIDAESGPTLHALVHFVGKRSTGFARYGEMWRLEGGGRRAIWRYLAHFKKTRYYE